MRVWLGLILIGPILISLGAVRAPAAETLELRGQIVPPLRSAWVGLHAASRPFRTETLSDLKGRFRFKKLEPGGYSIIVFHPRWGEQRQSVEVTPSFADNRNRVEVTFVVKRSETSRDRQTIDKHTVSALELSVSDKARLAFVKANEHIEKKEIERAVERLQEAVEISPQFAEAWNQLGTISYQSGDYTEAEKYFREALLIESDSFGPVVNMGATLLSLGRYVEALGYNRYAVTLRPDDPLAHSQLGRNHFLLGSYKPAIEHLRRAKGIDPGHFSLPQVTLAEIYSRQGKVDAAIRELEDYLDRHPDSERAELTRQTLARLKERPKAEPAPESAPAQP